MSCSTVYLQIFSNKDQHHNATDEKKKAQRGKSIYSRSQSKQESAILWTGDQYSAHLIILYNVFILYCQKKLYLFT